jgi:magnesium-transporting ATPase (P-type)
MDLGGSVRHSRSLLSSGHWHSSPIAEVLVRLKVGQEPLTQEMAAARIKIFGPNDLPAPKRPGPIRRFLRQFHNLLLYIMLVAAGITALLGDWIDSGVLLGAVIVNVIIGFIQEGRAEKALEALHAMLPSSAVVVRNGAQISIPASQLVPGDRVLLAAGDRVPADLRLTSVHELRIDESPLTGESSPVDKNTQACPADCPVSERANMAFSGTFAVYGRAEGIVVETGSRTELGKINAMLSAIPELATPLTRQINRFGRYLALAILSVAALLFWLGVEWRDLTAVNMFTLVVALAASAIPEGLPAIITITLALGVQRMAHRRAIVRRLPAVESLGSVTTICTDKTGTLTRNEMTVQRIVTSDSVVDVSGAGYSPKGGFSVEGVPIDPHHHPLLAKVLTAGLLCNEALYEPRDGHWILQGDPTEGALLVVAAKAGMWQTNVLGAWQRRGLLPFESVHRFMAAHLTDPEGQHWIFAKGAPERVFDFCKEQLELTGGRPLNVEFWKHAVISAAAQGLRILALASKASPPINGRLDHRDVEEGLTLLGIVGIMDPPRPEARPSVQECHNAGISVKMFTGDHLATAQSIGARIGIGLHSAAVEGSDLSHLSAADFRITALSSEIFARTSPEDKLRLVQALRSAGEVVAMTGDGVNDAPALKQADVGVAMGMNGTEVARQAADIILADDNFATITAAIREGRAVYDNIQKFILFMLPTNGGEALVVIASVVLHTALALTPSQILWINMVTSSTLGLALAFEPAECDIMKRAPHPPGESLISRFFVWRLIYVSILMTLAALGLFYWEYEHGTDLPVARTMCVTTIVISEAFYLFCSRSFFATTFSWEALTGNRMVLLSVAACIPLQWAYSATGLMQLIFESTPLTAVQWLKTVGAASFVFFGSEAEKWALRCFKKLRPDFRSS